MATSAIGLISWIWANSDRVMKLLTGLLDGLPKLGDTLEEAGGAMIKIGGKLQAKEGDQDARGEVDRVRALLKRQKEAYTTALGGLDFGDELKRIKVPNVHLGEQSIKLPLGAATIQIPRVDVTDGTPLEGVATKLSSQIVHFKALADALDEADEVLGTIGGILDETAGVLDTVGARLQKSGGELKALAA